MASKVLVDSSELNCSICLDIFKDPRVLPCVHSFCYGCLEGWINKSESSQTITCPLCRDVSPIPSGGLNKIKDNNFIADLVARMHNMDLKSVDGEFESTKENVPFSNVRYIYCQIHVRNVIDQYCVDCDLPACGTCLLRDHKHHKLVDLDEQAEISKQQLQCVLEQTDVLNKRIEEQINESDKYDEQSTIDIKNVASRISNVIDGIISKTSHKYISKLNQQKQELLNSLDKVEEQKEKVLMTVHDGQEFTKTAMTSLMSYTQTLLSHGRDYDIVQQAGDIQSRLVSIIESRVPSFTWSLHDKTPAKTMIPRFLQRRLDKRTAQKDDMTVAEVSMTTDVMDTETKSICDYVVSKIPLIRSQWASVRVMAVMHHTLWVVTRDRKCLLAYPLTSPHTPQTLSIHGMYDPSDMVRFPPGESQLVISERMSKRLLWIQLVYRHGMWQVTSERILNVKYSPYSLGVRENQLLVCSLDDKSDLDLEILFWENDIHVLSTSGEETHSVNIEQGVMACKAVAQLTSPGFVLVSDSSPKIVLVTEKGHKQHKYRGQKKGFKSGDIVCHGHSIYVTDWHNHRVDQLSVDGRHVRQIIRGHGVRQPGKMCVDDTGRLYVTHGEWMNKKEVWVIDTPGALSTQQTNMNLSVTWWN